jgi:hypothetical protein
MGNKELKEGRTLSQGSGAGSLRLGTLGSGGGLR